MTIFDINDSIQSHYDSSISLSEGLNFSLKKTVQRIEYITNSEYLSGKLDENGREKPFYNIADYRLNVAVTATDFDTKDIQIVSDTADYVRSMLLQKEVHYWMKDTHFSQTLNRMIETRAKYGWLMVKKIVKGDELMIETIDPRNVVINQVDPLANPIKEIHDISRYDLSKKREAWETDVVDAMLETDEEKFKVFEITGYMPNSVDGGDQNQYSLYRYVITSEDEILYSEELDELPYDYVDWKNTQGRVGRGVIEDIFEAQTWTNEVKLMEREATIMASKTGFITNDPNIINDNVRELDNGFILNVQDGKQMNQLNTMTNALPAFDRLKQDWDEQAERVTSTFAAVTGETMPSSTPFRSVALQNQSGNSVFGYRREEMGIFLKRVFENWVIPFLAKSINREHILSSEFSAHELSKIDESFSVYSANQRIKDTLLKGDFTEPINAERYQEIQDEYRELVQETDNQRFVQIPKNYFKDLDYKVSVVTTDEQRNKAVVLESLSKILADVSNTYDPNTGTFALLEDPTLATIFSKAVELSGAGISPVTINKIQAISSNKGAREVQGENLNVPEVDAIQEGVRTESNILQGN